MKLATMFCILPLIGLSSLGGQVALAQQKKAAPIAPAQAAKDGWDEIDQRLVFLMIRLANTETSLDAVEKTITATQKEQSARIGDAKRAATENEFMDRNGGGPVHWSVFYGQTAEKFFYHPTDRNSTYHTITVLSQQLPQTDNRSSTGVPSRQGLPVHQRPPQFDYIYRANQEANERAEAEADKLKNKIDALLERRRKLELEQNGLWVEIVFRAVAHLDLDKRPLFRFEPIVAADHPDAELHADILKSAAIFAKIAMSIIDEAKEDQASAFSRIKPTISAARQALNDRWLRLGVDSSDRLTTEGKFAALAKRLDDVSQNLSESYAVAVDGDQHKDLFRKQMFRRQLQESLVRYAEIVLALDEMAIEMRDKWKIKPDLDKPLAITTNSMRTSIGGLSAGSTWVGLGVHTKGPSAGKEFQHVALRVTARNGQNFKASWDWTAFANKTFGNGSHEVVGKVDGREVDWQGAFKAHAELRDGALFVKWENPPYFGETVFVPESTFGDKKQLAGKYRISENGAYAFELTLDADGAAKKSHARETLGAWQPLKAGAFIVWSDGWRDLLVRTSGHMVKKALPPGASIEDEPINLGIATRAD